MKDVKKNYFILDYDKTINDLYKVIIIIKKRSL